MSVYKGAVQKGERRGTKLGFPTANIALGDVQISGVYAATVLLEGKEYQAAVFADTTRKVLEAYLLDFSGDLYGKEITITLGRKIRERMEFTDQSQLILQISKDIDSVKNKAKNS